MRRPVPIARVEGLLTSSHGLDSAQVRERRDLYGPNAIVEVVGHPAWNLVRDTARDPMIWFLVLTSLVYAILGQTVEAATLFASLLPLIGMDAYLHRRTQASTEGLGSRIASRARVLRNGQTLEIPAVEVVVGDLALVAGGESFPADGLILEGNDLQVDESALTGESFPVRKHPLATSLEDGSEIAVESEQWGFAGTRVLTGRGTMRVVFGGGETLYGEIVRSASGGTRARTPLQASMSRLVAMLTAGAAVICVALALVRLRQGYGWVDALVSAATLAVAALPEEFPVVLSIFLGVGVYRLARLQALVRRAASVESIGRVTCICSDKTGTITEGRLALARVLPAEGLEAADLLGAAALASRRETGDPLDLLILHEASAKGLLAPGTEMLALFPFTEDRRRETIVARREDGTLIAVTKGSPETILPLTNLEAGEKHSWSGQLAALADSGFKIIACAQRTLNADEWAQARSASGRQEAALSTGAACAAAARDAHADMTRAAAGPAPTDGSCTVAAPAARSAAAGTAAGASSWTAPGAAPGQQPASATERETAPSAGSAPAAVGTGACAAPAAKLAAAGTAAGASSWTAPGAAPGQQPASATERGTGQAEPGAEPDRGYRFLGLLACEDPVREGVRAAVEACRAGGIRTVMVTGDHPGTARAVARAIGLGQGAPVVITGDELEARVRAGEQAALRRVDVVARALPAQKLALVRALQAAGEIVAVTGDGVNDVPALQAADVGIAMGEGGTRSAREVAAIVLLDDNFRTIVRAVGEGRQLFKNLQLSYEYLLMMHIPLVLTAAIIPLVGFPLLYLPVHIVWLELIIHPTALLVFQRFPSDAGLGFARPSPPARFFAARDWALIGTVGLLVTLLVAGAYFRNIGAEGSAEHARAMALATLALVSTLLTAVLSGLRTAVARIVALTSLGVSVLLIQAPPLAALLRLRPLHLDEWIQTSVGSLLCVCLPLALARIAARVRARRDAETRARGQALSPPAGGLSSPRS